MGTAQTKNKRKEVRLTEEEYEKIALSAERAGKNMSDYMITSALENKIVIIDDFKPLIDEIRNLSIEVKRVGKNVDRIALLVNMGKIECVNIDKTQQDVNKLHGDVITMWNSMVRLQKKIKRQVSKL